MNKLKSCPFCGERKIKMVDHQSLGETYYYAKCPNCFATSGWYKPKCRAIKAWNRRVSE